MVKVGLYFERKREPVLLINEELKSSIDLALSEDPIIGIPTI